MRKNYFVGFAGASFAGVEGPERCWAGVPGTNSFVLDGD